MKTKISRQMKRISAVILAAGIMVSSFSTTINSEAASKKQTVYVVRELISFINRQNTPIHIQEKVLSVRLIP